MTPTLLSLLATTALTVPQISDVQPSPLPVAATAEVSGAGFIADQTSVVIGGASQPIYNVQPDKIRFAVANDTPLGTQPLVVTTTDGSAEVSVEIVAPLPKITAVSPERLVLGELATIQGDSLDTVTSVQLGEVEATITEQTRVVIVFEVPFDETLVGTQGLTVTSPSGRTSRTIEVVPPTPEIDAIGPNPARQGDLVEIRGNIVALNVAAKIGLIDAPVVTARSGAVTVQVPDAVPVGPHDVTVSVGVLTSPPAGPLYIEQAAHDRPVVRGVYPSNVARGGALWVVGQELATIDAATHGLVVRDCDRTACVLDTSDAALGGPITAAVTGPSGAAVFTISVLDEDPVVPAILSVTPQPAFRGQALTISGAQLQSLKTVVIGGQTQSVTFFGTNEIELTVHPETPLGAERLFVTTNAGSEPFTVTILDPLPSTDADAATTNDADVSDGGGDAAPPDTSPSDDGCAGGGQPEGPLAALVAWLLMALSPRTARRSGPHLHLPRR